MYLSTVTKYFYSVFSHFKTDCEWLSYLSLLCSSWRAWEQSAGLQTQNTPFTPSIREDCLSWEPATNSSFPSLPRIWSTLTTPPATSAPFASTSEKRKKARDGLTGWRQWVRGAFLNICRLEKKCHFWDDGSSKFARTDTLKDGKVSLEWFCLPYSPLSQTELSRLRYTKIHVQSRENTLRIWIFFQGEEISFWTSEKNHRKILLAQRIRPPKITQESPTSAAYMWEAINPSETEECTHNKNSIHCVGDVKKD